MTSGSRTCRRTAVASDGVLFDSCQQTSYKSVNYHRATATTKHPKSQWNVSRDDECHTFCRAEAESWKDAKGNYWAVAEAGDPDLGTRGERVAFFDAPRNPRDPWHGFPVGTKRGALAFTPPPDDLVLKWHTSGFISYTEQQRILTRRR